MTELWPYLVHTYINDLWGRQISQHCRFLASVLIVRYEKAQVEREQSLRLESCNQKTQFKSWNDPFYITTERYVRRLYCLSDEAYDVYSISVWTLKQLLLLHFNTTVIFNTALGLWASRHIIQTDSRSALWHFDFCSGHIWISSSTSWLKGAMTRPASHHLDGLSWSVLQFSELLVAPEVT